MNKFELGYLLRAASNHALQQTQKLVCRTDAAQWLSVIQHLTKFHIELGEWCSGKIHLNDRSSYFLKEAEAIEAQADAISESLWRYAPVSLTPIFRKIQVRRAATKNDGYPKQLRAQFNNFRLGLLEQFAGARLLENNSDLGDEFERILLQYLERRIGSTMRILRGGHVYDYANNRSGQIDIIITPGNALGFCPADTGDGKYNVLVDQVIAAISVTSRLTADSLRERIQQLQAIPRFDPSIQHFARSSGLKWPLCYIIGADCDDVQSLQKVWGEFGSLENSPLQMIVMLDSGFIRAWSFFAKNPGSDQPIKHERLRSGTDVYGGLGLAWLEAQIMQYNCLWTNQASDWVARLCEQLAALEATDDAMLTHDANRDRLPGPFPLHGTLNWGFNGQWVHNKLFLLSICTGTPPLPANTLLDMTKPKPRNGPLDLYDFELRWFRAAVKAIKGDYCALEEWIDPSDHQKHQHRIVVFDCRTGTEVTHKLARQLNDCSEIEQLDLASISPL
jgi:hypothetical protein